jgi:hypothetical protein
MVEVWLRTNRRAILWAMVPPTAIVAAGALLLMSESERGTWTRVFSVALILIGALCLALLAAQLRRPRLAYDDGHLLVYLRRGQPIRVPVEVVECFLLGQSASHLPASGGRLKTSTVLIRLCPQAAPWVRGKVDPRLGEWRDSHFVIRGTWCEPLSVELVRRLNASLAQVTRARRGSAAR